MRFRWFMRDKKNLKQLQVELDKYLNDRSYDRKVIPCCDEILELKPKDVYVLATKLLYLGLAQRWDEHKELIKWLDENKIVTLETLENEKIRSRLGASNFSEFYKIKVMEAIKDKKYGIANEYCDKWLKMSPGYNTQIALFRAEILTALNRRKEALDYLNEAINKDCTIKRIHTPTARCLIVSTHTRFYPLVLKERAKVLVFLKKYAEAIKDYETLVKDYSRDDEAKILLKKLKDRIKKKKNKKVSLSKRKDIEDE